MPLLDRIASRSATTGIIGQGDVGLPLALAFTEAGLPVGGADRGQAAALFQRVKLVTDARTPVAPLFAGRPLPFRLVKA